MPPVLGGPGARSCGPARVRTGRRTPRGDRGDAGGARGLARPRWGPERPAHRAPRLPARRDAAPAPLEPRSDLVTWTTPTTMPRAREIAATVLDPELPMVTIEDLGILRDVTEDDQGRVHVTTTPTSSGCPAMETIRDDLVDSLTLAGYQHVDVEFVLSPAWSTDDLTDAGRRK